MLYGHALAYIRALDIATGGVAVDQAFERYIRQRLSSIALPAHWDVESTALHAQRDFESNSKRHFEVPSGTCSVRIGPMSLSVKQCNIRRGTLTIPW